MTEFEKPFPVPDHMTKPFWDALAHGELRLPKCASCERYVFYPRSVCPHCMDTEFEWVVAVGTGTVYSYTVVHRAPPAFSAPYVVALVDLDEGVRLMTRIVDLEDAPLRVGMRVQLILEGDPAMPNFRPAPTD